MIELPVLAIFGIDDIITFIIVTAIMAAISYGIAVLTAPKPKSPDVPAAQELNAPTVSEGASYPVIFGTPKRLEGYLIAWWGDVKTSEVATRKNHQHVTLGYDYYIGMHILLCHGPVDGVKQIYVGDELAWPNHDDKTEIAADNTTAITINEPDLFGGDYKEGGVVGNIDVQYGGSSQTPNSYLTGKLAETDISASRGLVGVILKQVNTGMSPYLKQWSFLVKRTTKLDDGSTQWYSAKSDISGDLNPAHIIRECFTNTRWGLKYSTGLFDDSIWQAAANTLYTEGFGLSAAWSGNTDIESFIGEILKAINAVIYQRHSDGKFIIKLIRDDYTIGNLTTYDDSDIVSVEDFTRGSYGLVPNVVNVKYSDIYKNDTAAVSAHDIAVMDVQGGRSIPLELDYKYVTKAALASKIAARELRQATSFPASMTIKGNRSMSGLYPGDVFILSWPILGITQMVVRVGEVNYGSLQDGVVTLKCVEDIFATAAAIYSDSPATGWSNPISEPAASPAQLLLETPFYDLANLMGLSLAAALNSDAGYLTVNAAKPSDDSYAYELLLRDSLTSDFENIDRPGFTPTALLTANLPMNAVEAEIELESVKDLDIVQVGDYAVIGSEIVLVKDVDTANSTVTIARGVLDTVPAAHSDGDRIWFVGSRCSFVNREYVDGDQPGVKILPITSKGTFAEGSATAVNASAMDSRAVRPYPPGNVKIDGSSYPASFSGEPVLTWSHRDRTQQVLSIVEHSAASIGPETGTTYTLKIYGNGGTLKRTVTGITDATYTYLDADEKADNGGNLNSSLRFELWSVRDGFDSWQKYDITVART